MEMLKKIIEDGSMWLKGVVGLFPANRSEDGEDVEHVENDADGGVVKMLVTVKQS